MSNIVIPNPDSSLIYEGGGVSQIVAEELTGNIVAIRQLINSHNLIANETKIKTTTITSLSSQVEYLKTSPFIAVSSAILNIVGSLLIAIGVNFVTGEKSASIKNIIVLCCGVVIVIVASALNILYPYARTWFNSKSTTVTT